MYYADAPHPSAFSIEALMRQDSPETNTASELCAVLMNMPQSLVARVFLVLPTDTLTDVLDAARHSNPAFAECAPTYNPARYVEDLMAATPVQLCQWLDHLCRLSVAGLDEIFRPIIRHGSPARLHNLSMRARSNEYWYAYDWLARYVVRPARQSMRDPDLELAIARSLEYVPAIAASRAPLKLQADTHSVVGGMCIICYDELTRPATLPCGHKFDLACITDWYNTQVGTPTCPMCRAPFG